MPVGALLCSGKFDKKNMLTCETPLRNSAVTSGRKKSRGALSPVLELEGFDAFLPRNGLVRFT